MDRTYQTESVAELFAALAKAQGEITHAAKAADNPHFRSKYADLPAVMDAARPHLAKNGLAVAQITDFDADGNMLLMTQLSHSTGQWIRSWYPVRPVQNTPQGIGSALTYARRYAYCALVGVAADDDDDGNAASNGNPTPPAQKKTPDAKPVNEAYAAAKAAALVECPVFADGTLDYDIFGADFETRIVQAKSMNELTSLKTANGKTLNRMKVDRPEMFDAIVGEFTKATAKYQ